MTKTVGVVKGGGKPAEVNKTESKPIRAGKGKGLLRVG